jgi:hypothetical protein
MTGAQDAQNYIVGVDRLVVDQRRSRREMDLQGTQVKLRESIVTKAGAEGHPHPGTPRGSSVSRPGLTYSKLACRANTPALHQVAWWLHRAELFSQPRQSPA